MLIYISGPYSAYDEYTVADNIERAAVVARALWEAGHAVICPHLNTAGFEKTCQATYDQYIAGDLNMIARVDAMVMTHGWAFSKGANIEHEYAVAIGLPVYYWPDVPPLHPTEVRCPAQAQAFREIAGQMYRVHLQKNADYSPLNILMTGEVGLVTRLWDKIARLLNLTGFRAEITRSEFSAPRTPKNESIEDSFLDAAVYSIIGLLLRRGVWGR